MPQTKSSQKVSTTSFFYVFFALAAAVEECAKLLTAAGFQELRESESWKIEPLKKYYLTRNRSCVIAFAVGGQFKPGNGFSMVGAHTDSPCLKVKPISKLSSGGCLQVAVSTYGGGLWRTWFDRDLTVAGRVIVKKEDRLVQRLLHVKRPILNIPNLAIHLDTDREKFVFNKEEHLRPILASKILDQLIKENSGDTEKKEDESKEHHSAFLSLIAAELDVSVKDIIDFELCVIDANPACLSGIYEEFVSGGRLDNLVGTYTAITSLINSCHDKDQLAKDPNIRLAAAFDNEEDLPHLKRADLGMLSIDSAETSSALIAIVQQLSSADPALYL